jgi:hypothetical protein
MINNVILFNFIFSQTEIGISEYDKVISTQLK